MRRMNRRTFIGTSIAATLAAAAKPSWAPEAAHKIDRIGLQLYTVRDAMKTDFEGTIAKVAATGYKEVEFAGYFDHSPEDVRAVLGGAVELSAEVLQEWKILPTAHALTAEEQDALDIGVVPRRALLLRGRDVAGGAEARAARPRRVSLPREQFPGRLFFDDGDRDRAADAVLTSARGRDLDRYRLDRHAEQPSGLESRSGFITRGQEVRRSLVKRPSLLISWPPVEKL